jgi:hypothetical protein
MLQALALALLLAADPAPAVNPAVARIAASATRPQAPDVRSQVETYLDSIDTPISDERWRALGPQAPVVLEEIARDPSRLPTRRARAVSALGVVGTDRSRELMLALARDEGEPALLRASAVHAAAPTLATPVETLRPLLERAKNPRVRAAAAEALVLRSPALACATVQKQVAREKASQRPAFRRALAGCRK